jgi:hypothetical protein
MYYIYHIKEKEERERERESRKETEKISNRKRHPAAEDGW